MLRKNALPELLAPAGDMEALYAAIAAGADAIYVGGKRFGARAFAKNFDDEELRLAVSYCHLHGVKLYVTVNTLIFDREMDEVSDYAAFLYSIGVDAVIAADLGAIRVMRERVPKLEIHASTQMSVHNTAGAEMAASLGCTRVVLARELSSSAISSVTRGCSVETEVFLHGALCVCHSGQCLFSSLVGGRSGNRGECAQPCRLPYNGKYPLSLSDLSLASHIRELIGSGVASLKIEGRMKSPDYVFTVTSIYRRLLDEGRDANELERAELAKIFSRGGFTDGYFTGKLSGMTGVRSESDKAVTKELAGRSFLPERVRVRAKARFVIGEPCEMTLTDGTHEISVTGEPVERAISAPLDRTSLLTRLSKMGNTFLVLDPSDIDLVLDDGANLSMGAINSLRRLAAECFESSAREVIEKKLVPPPRVKKIPLKTALFLSVQALYELDEADLSHFDAVFAPAFSENAAFSLANGVYLPPVLSDSDLERLEARLSDLKALGVRFALVTNIGQIPLVRSVGLVPVADIRMNITNSYTSEVLFDLGVESQTVSAELDLPKARDIGGAVTVYGRIPLMLTERCFTKETFSCSECGQAALTDRRGKRFPMMREYEHRMLLLNSEITYMADRQGDIIRAGLSEHFIFSTEKSAVIRSVISAFKKSLGIDAVFPGERPRRLGMRMSEKK